MQNARDMLMAKTKFLQFLLMSKLKKVAGDVPQPKIPAIPMAFTMAQGTAVAAFPASSEIWTLESKLQIVHRGARKLRMKA